MKQGRAAAGRLWFWISLVVLLAAWQYSAQMGYVAKIVLPAPLDIVARVWSDLQSADVRSDFLYTLTEILAGFSIALVVGVSLGMWIAMSPTADQVISPYVVALQTVPKVAVAPLLVIWFGFGIESKIVIVALVDLFPILVNAVTGFRNIDTRQLLLMHVIEATPMQTFLKVRLPNALPYMMAGIQVSVVFSVIGAIVGEFIGSSRGLGAQILQRQAGMDVVGVYSIIVILSLLGTALSLVVRAITKRVTFWAESNEAIPV